MTVFENLELALKADKSVRKSLFFRLNAEQLERIDEVLGIIALGPDRERQAGELSHGQKQWLEIGMLLACRSPDAPAGRRTWRRA